MTAIQIEHLRKQFGETTVISDLNLSIRSGELLVLVGPSGCGKSTVLRMIAGLEAISGGTISIGGRVVNEVLPKDRDVAMVFQSYALYPHMTVSDNIGFGLKIRKIPKEAIQEKVLGIAKTLGLSDYLTRKPKALSGGQRQRVALGRAITRQPKVFLFDEPLSNLDAELRVQMRAEIGRLHKQLNTTSVYVTHDQIEAMTMGHRIAVMQRGDLLQVGAPLHLYDHPESIFVARFIGTPPMNFVQADINSDGTRLLAKGFDLPIADALATVARAHRGKAVVLGFRPDSITESSPDQNGFHAPVQGPVTMVEPLGDEVIVHMKVNDAPVVAKLGSRNIPALDEQITLALDCRRLHLFDPQSEQRLSA